MKRNALNEIKKIKNGQGIQYILDEAYRILGNPVLIHDMEYRFIACPAGVITDDPIFSEYLRYGKVTNETIELFKDECFIEDVANSNGVTYLISDKLKYDRIFGQIYNRDHIPVADLCAVACDKAFEENAPEVIKAICNVLSKEISGIEFYHYYGQAYQENILGELITGNIHDRRIYTAHVENIYKSLKTNIFVVVADIIRCDPTRATLVYWRDLFKQTHPLFKYAIFSEYIVILISSDHTIFDMRRLFGKLYRLFEENNIIAGVSSGFENLFELQGYYSQAFKALNYGLQYNGNQYIFRYDEVVIDKPRKGKLTI